MIEQSELSDSGPSADARADDRTIRVPALSAALVADAQALGAVYRATREALRCTSPAEVAAVTCRLVEELGGRTVPAAQADDGALPPDLSFGVGPPVLATADTSSLASVRLHGLLPAFLEDANHLVQFLRVHQVVQQDASVDALTGLVARRVVEAALLSASPGDVVILIDLDHFKAINDERGHATGDEVLIRFARLLQNSVRAGDVCGRYGGEELLVVQPATDLAAASTRLLSIRDEWRRIRPVPCTFSAGVAQVGDGGPKAAFAAADAALYRAKEAGRDQIRVAHVEQAATIPFARLRAAEPPHA